MKYSPKSNPYYLLGFALIVAAGLSGFFWFQAGQENHSKALCKIAVKFFILHPEASTQKDKQTILECFRQGYLNDLDGGPSPKILPLLLGKPEPRQGRAKIENPLPH